MNTVIDDEIVLLSGGSMDRYTYMCSKLEEAYGLLNSIKMIMYDEFKGEYTHPEVKEKIEKFIDDLRDYY